MKKIIILAYYGTMNHRAGEKIYTAIKSRFQESFPFYEIEESFNSKRIVKKLKEVHNIHLETLKEKLEFLKSQESNKKISAIEILIQPIYLTEGTQYEEILDIAEKYKDSFLSVKTGKPLFTDFFSFEKILKIFEKIYLDSETAYIFLGHGSKGAGKDIYAALGYFFQLKHHNFFTCTIEEGVPLSIIVENILKNYKKVVLVPLLLVPGYHFKQDIQEKFVNFFKKLNFPVECVSSSLGENLDVIELFVEKIKK